MSDKSVFPFRGVEHGTRSPFYLVWPLFSDIVEPFLYSMRISFCEGKYATTAKLVTQFDILLDDDYQKDRDSVLSIAESQIVEKELTTKEWPVLIQLNCEKFQDMTGIPIRRV
jgi:hypothetical protein